MARPALVGDRALVAGEHSTLSYLDSSSGNQRPEDSKNREAWVRRPADRRSVGWLCRRGGRRLRACWPAGGGGRGSGEWGGCRRWAGVWRGGQQRRWWKNRKSSAT